MVNEVLEFLRECPRISGRAVNINHLSHRVGACSLETADGGGVVKVYADGGRILKQKFVLAIRAAVCEDLKVGAETAKLFDDVREWLAKQENSGRLPRLVNGAEAVSLKAERGWARVGAGSVDARYEMGLELVYLV